MNTPLASLAVFSVTWVSVLTSAIDAPGTAAWPELSTWPLMDALCARRCVEKQPANRNRLALKHFSIRQNRDRTWLAPLKICAGRWFHGPCKPRPDHPGRQVGGRGWTAVGLREQCCVERENEDKESFQRSVSLNFKNDVMDQKKGIWRVLRFNETTISKAKPRLIS